MLACCSRDTAFTTTPGHFRSSATTSWGYRNDCHALAGEIGGMDHSPIIVGLER